MKLREVRKKNNLNETLSAFDMKDAYSFPRVGYIIGEGIVESCRDMGYSDSDIKKIFNSKHIRWFMDAHDDVFLKMSKRLFLQYLKQDKNQIRSDYPLSNTQD